MKHSASIQAGKSQLGSWRARLLTGITAALCALAFTGSAFAAVPVDQQPLIVSQPLPPNIVLMLDDSGSMAWDYMPDWGYLSSTSGNAPVSSAVNGVYYNPTIKYTPPVKADGTSYPGYSNTFPNAPLNGFNPPANTSSYTDITNYSSPTESFKYYYSPTSSESGSSCQSNTSPSSKYSGYCYSSNGSLSPAYKFYDDSNGYYYYSAICSLGAGQCITGNVFRYGVGTSTYYVSPSGCGSLANCVTSANASGTAAPAGIQAGVNVANWFAYYHTRILMAKSGLMNAFSTLDPKYRFGFASINGRNTAGIPSPTYTFTTSTNSNNKLAEVEPFGDGTSGTQKDEFWTWLIGETPSNSTPLRGALKAVGQYYSTDQPWETSSSDTTKYACRQSYAILTTDGFWNGANPNVENADGTSGDVNGGAITGPNSKSYTYSAVAPYSDSQSNTLADVAMYYWKNDLQTGVLNEVPTSTEDPAFWQHMTTFTVGLGFDPTGISPSGTTIDQIFSWANGGAAISNFSWPTPSADSINNIADLAHAAVNGHGGFYSAKNPQDFATGIADALKRASERVGTGASLAANSTKLSTGTVTYQANYYTGKWKGDLKAYAVNPNTGAVATTPTWTAVTALPTAANRNIWTYNPSGNNANSRYIAFKSSSTLSNAEYTALGGSTTPSASTNMINYLRGDATYEIKNGGTYRNRDTPLGDIVNSQPVYVGAPDPNLFSGQSFTGYSDYATFAANESTRSGQIYVAANDGMLHAFDAATGAETFAYLPAAVITSGLSTLSNKDYGTTTAVPHQFFNDGEVTVSDIYVSSGTGKGWHTILVGTTGRGTAKTVYALDVTDPTSIQFLWERSAGDGKTNSNYIGQMSGKPVIAQTADKQWQVLMGNGYNSASNTAVLLEFALTSASGSWDTSGTLTAITTNSTVNNGLAAPVTWIGNPTNGISTVAYAGDLFGNVWSFNLAGNTSTKLFTATDTNGNAQPITAGMLAGMDPATKNVWLFFGTGKYLGAADLNDMSTQSWYGIIVQSGPGQLTSLVSNLLNGRSSSLVNRSIIAEVPPTAGDPTATPPVPPTLGLRAFTIKPTTDDMTGKSGWYIDLTSPVNGAEGERMVTPNQFQGSLLIGTSRIPQAADVCNPTGRGWIMALDPFTGTNPASNFFDTNGDGKFDATDMVLVSLSDGTTQKVPAGGVGFSSLPNNPIFVGNTMLVSFDDGSTSSIATAGSVGSLSRTSWREIVNQ